MSRLNTLTLVTTLIVALLSALLYKHNHQFLDTTLTIETTTQLLKTSGLSASLLDSILSKIHATPTSKDMSAASRTIRKVFLAAETAEGVGAKVRRSIGTPHLRNFTPFLMLDHFSVKPGAGFPDQ